ncbi:MAG: HEAT repeat domain-containing protein [Candidatus Margulisiibacteriota bacterium]
MGTNPVGANDVKLIYIPTPVDQSINGADEKAVTREPSWRPKIKEISIEITNGSVNLRGYIANCLQSDEGVKELIANYSKEVQCELLNMFNELRNSPLRKMDAIADARISIMIINAIKVFSEKDDKTTAKRIAETLNDQSLPARYAALEAVPKLGLKEAKGELVKMLKDSGNQKISEKIIDVLSLFGESASDQLSAVLSDESVDLFVRERAAEALGNCYGSGASALVSALGDRSRSIQASAERALVRLGNYAINAIMYELSVLSSRDKNPDLMSEESRREVYDKEHEIGNVLGQMKGKAVVERLNEYLVQVDSPIIRKQLIRALGMIGDKSSVKPIIASIKEDGTYNKFEAEQALVSLRDSAMDALLKESGSKNGSMREISARILSNYGDSRAETTLVKMMKDKNPIIREHAVFGLSRISGAKYIYLYIAALSDENPYVRQIAVKALSSAKTKRVVMPLVRSIKDADYQVRDAAFRALREIKDRSALPALEKLTEDRDVGQRVKQLIEDIKTEK